MEIDSFNQCLAYMQVAFEKKSLVEKFLPLIGALGGAFIGFFLNYFASHSKESKTARNKLMCCNEDIEKIRESLILVIKELFRLGVLISNRELPKGHKLPTGISALCLSEYFADVAHKFSGEQRYQIQRILEDMKALNTLLPILQARDTLSDKYRYSLKLTNTIILAVKIYNSCEGAINKKTSKEESVNNLKNIGANDDEIQAFSKLKENGNNENKTLSL